MNCILCQIPPLPVNVYDPDILDAYPNPASNEVLMHTGMINGPCYLECYDLGGKELFLAYQFDDDLGRFVINTSSLEPGLYLFKVSSSSSSRIAMIVIQ